MKTLPIPNLTNANLLPLRAMTPAERSKGRFMRAPDGHGDGGDASEAGEGQADAEVEADDTSVLGAAGEGGEGTKGEKGEGEDGTSGGEAAAEGAPEKYELTPSEGFTIDPEALAFAEPVFRDLNLSNEKAQKLMPAAEQFAQRIIGQANDAITQRSVDQRREWSEAYEADPELGGANKAATEAAAARAFDHYGLKKGEGLRQLLDESGLGNHPDMIRFVSGVGRDLAEGSFERGDAAAIPKTPEQKLYDPAFHPKT